MRFPLERFWNFGTQLRIPSKEAGSVPLTPLGTQRYFAQEVARGLEDGVHYFLALKGRQLGFSIGSCALDLFWMLDYADMQGALITDSDENHVYFRDILSEMLLTLPEDYRLPLLVNNDDLLRFGRRDDGHGGSRLTYQIAGVSKRKRARVGRGRGLNYLHADEVGYWSDQKSIGALESALAEYHPHRLYVFGGTANGFDAFHDMWTSAEHAVSQRRIFIGWWRDERKVAAHGTPLFNAYGNPELTQDERLWVRAIKAEYDFDITAEQVAWRRYQLAERFRGDEDMLSQEFPCMPSDAFVAFGDKFIKPATIRRLRAEAASEPTPDGFRYVWAPHFNRVRVTPCDLAAADLKVWEEPNDGGVYLVGAKPPDDVSDDGAITVWRIFPDLMRQVAEYAAKGDTTYQFTWAMLHLAGAYSISFSAFLSIEMDGTGGAVIREMDRLRDSGWGLSPDLRSAQPIRDMVSSFREYLFRKPDSFGKRLTRGWSKSPEARAMLFHELRNCVERGAMQIRSGDLITGLGAVRSGAEVDTASSASARVYSAAVGAVHYLASAVGEIENLVPPSRKQEGDPEHVGELLVQNFIGERMLTGRYRR